MSDRIDELVGIVFDGFCTGQMHSFHEHNAAARELATIARKAEAEADKWRKVAEEVAKMAADLSDEFVGAGAGPGEFIDEAVRRILIEQEEAE